MPGLRLRHRLALVTALVAGIAAFGGRRGRQGLLAAGLLGAGGLVAKQLRQPLDAPIEYRPAPWPAYPIVGARLFGLDLDENPCPAGADATPRGRIRFVDGVPQCHYPTAGWQPNPAYVAWWGLQNLNRYLDSGDAARLDAFRTQVEWLVANAKEWGGTPDAPGYAWTYDFGWTEGEARLRAPWISGLAQGLAISLLTRAATCSISLALSVSSARLLSLAEGAARVLARNIEAGGLRSAEDGYDYYEEYPARPYPRVLDGFAFAVLGLHDFCHVANGLIQPTPAEAHTRPVGATAEHQVRPYVSTRSPVGADLVSARDPGAARDLGSALDLGTALFDTGMRTLAERGAQWDCLGRWSWYGHHRLLATPQYNKLNAVLLLALSQLGEDGRLAELGYRWLPRPGDPVQRTLVALSPALLALFHARRLLSRGSRLLSCQTTTDDGRRTEAIGPSVVRRPSPLGA